MIRAFSQYWLQWLLDPFLGALLILDDLLLVSRYISLSQSLQSRFWLSDKFRQASLIMFWSRTRYLCGSGEVRREMLAGIFVCTFELQHLVFVKGCLSLEDSFFSWFSDQYSLRVLLGGLIIYLSFPSKWQELSWLLVDSLVGACRESWAGVEGNGFGRVPILHGTTSEKYK